MDEYLTVLNKEFPFQVNTTQDSPFPMKGAYLRSALAGDKVIIRFKTKTAYTRYIKELGLSGVKESR